jgi:hypothetical protein
LLTLNDQLAHVLPTQQRCDGKRFSKTHSGEFCRFWATPKASDAITGTTARTSGRAAEKTTHLAVQVHLCPTPRAVDGAKGQRTREGAEREANRGHGIDLPLFVQLFPTPTTHGNHNRKGSSAKSGDGLATVVKMLSNSTASEPKDLQREAKNDAAEASKGSLNPAWVEWLMGFPEGWTDLDVETSLCSPDPADLEWWSVEPDIPRAVKGIPRRASRLKALGNAVVPAQIYPIFAAIAAIHNDDDWRNES